MNISTTDYLPIQTLEKGEAGYPEKLIFFLGEKAPETLYVMGNIDLLGRESLGFCGSRNVTEKGLQIAQDCAEQAVEKNKVVISGNARGVDRMVHKTALRHGGETILVLPEGIQNFKINKELQPLWDWEKVLVVSEFPPALPWKTWNAMKRNKTILALVSAMIVVEAGDKGGTIAAGKDSLKMGVPLYVVNRSDFDSSLGSKHLLALGGIRLNKSEKLGRANMDNIFRRMSSSAHRKTTCLQCSLL